MKRAPRVTKRERKNRRCAVCKKEPRVGDTDICIGCLHRARMAKARR